MWEEKSSKLLIEDIQMRIRIFLNDLAKVMGRKSQC